MKAAKCNVPAKQSLEAARTKQIHGSGPQPGLAPAVGQPSPPTLGQADEQSAGGFLLTQMTMEITPPPVFVLTAPLGGGSSATECERH